MKCAVFCCSNNRRNFRGKSFFRFPKDELMCQEWLKAIGRLGYKPSEGSNVCEDHFDISDMHVGKIKKRLKCYVVPMHNFSQCASCSTYNTQDTPKGEIISRNESISCTSSSKPTQTNIQIIRAGCNEESNCTVPPTSSRIQDYTLYGESNVSKVVDDDSDQRGHGMVPVSFENMIFCKEEVPEVVDETPIKATYLQAKAEKKLTIKECMESSDEESVNKEKKERRRYEKLKTLRNVVLKKNKNIKRKQESIRDKSRQITKLKLLLNDIKKKNLLMEKVFKKCNIYFPVNFNTSPDKNIAKSERDLDDQISRHSGSEVLVD